MSRFTYQGRSKETVQNRATMQGGDFDSYLDSRARFMKVSEGDHTIRILPPTWDTKDKRWGDNWGIEVFIHRDIGPDKGAYLCPDKMQGKPCPICEARAEVEGDDELVKQLRPGKQTLAWVIDRDNESEGPQVMRVGIKAEKEIQTRSQDRKTGAIILIDDPEDGYDISFRRNGAGLKTEYVGWNVDRDPSPIHDKQSKQDAWLEFITDNPLPDLLIIHDYEYLDAVYRGKRSSKSDKADAEERGETRSSRRSREESSDEDDRRGRSRNNEEEDRRGRSRSRDDDDDDKDDRSSRGRGRDADDEKDERAERGRGRGRDEEKDERSSRSRGRDEEEDRSSRRRSRDDDDDRMPTDEEMKENSERARGRREEPEEDRSSRRRSRDDDDKDDKEPETRSRSRSRDDDDGKDEKGSGSVSRAKQSVERLKPRDKK